MIEFIKRLLGIKPHLEGLYAVFDDANGCTEAISHEAALQYQTIYGGTIKRLDEARLNNINFGRNGELSIQLEGGACGLFAQTFADQFIGSNAINYVEATFTCPEIGDLSVTMQKLSGKTPHQLRAIAQAEITALKKTNAELVELLTEAREDVAAQLDEYQDLLPYKQHRYDAQKETLDRIDEALAKAKQLLTFKG